MSKRTENYLKRTAAKRDFRYYISDAQEAARKNDYKAVMVALLLAMTSAQTASNYHDAMGDE